MLLVYRFHLISTCSSSSYCSSNSSSILWRRSCGIALWLGHLGCRCSAACRQQHGSIVTVNVKTHHQWNNTFMLLYSQIYCYFSRIVVLGIQWLYHARRLLIPGICVLTVCQSICVKLLVGFSWIFYQRYICKLCKSSASGSGSINVLEHSSTLQDRNFLSLCHISGKLIESYKSKSKGK